MRWLKFFGINCGVLAAMASQTVVEAPPDPRVPAPSVETLLQFDAAWRSESQERARVWKRRRVDTLSTEAVEALAVCRAVAAARPCRCWEILSFSK